MNLWSTVLDETQPSRWRRPRRPGRSVIRRQARAAGVFKANAARRRQVTRAGGVKQLSLFVSEHRVAVINPDADRRLAGKARRRARRDGRRIVAGFICPCGTQAWLTAGATAEDREWFDSLHAVHETCEADLDTTDGVSA